MGGGQETRRWLTPSVQGALLCLQRKTLLAPFGIRRYDTDSWGTYTCHLAADELQSGKCNTQKLERKHLTLCTRIKRLVCKMLCFSEAIQRHNIMAGLFVHRYAFDLRVQTQRVQIYNTTKSHTHGICP